jgi:hypothetical protein
MDTLPPRRDELHVWNCTLHRGTRAASPSQGVVTRRNALGLLSLLGCSTLAAAGHFWDAKPSSQWSPEEIAELAGNSPWAKEVTAQYRVGLEDTRIQPGSEPVQGRGEARAGECGLVPCGSIMPGKVTVVWESAQPIREALHPVISTELNGRYVISIRGLEGQYSLDQLEAGSDLSAKGKSPVQPGLVRQRNNSYLFGFSKDLMPLGVTDKEVLFTVRTGPRLESTLLRATFNPKDMIYRGALAL